MDVLLLPFLKHGVFFRFIYFNCMRILLACMYVTMYMPGPCRSQKKASDPQELMLYMVVSHCLSYFSVPVKRHHDQGNLLKGSI